MQQVLGQLGIHETLSLPTSKIISGQELENDSSGGALHQRRNKASPSGHALGPVAGFIACVRVNEEGWAPPPTPADGQVIETGMGLFGLYCFGIG